jgi:hypothetical protein
VARRVLICRINPGVEHAALIEDLDLDEGEVAVGLDGRTAHFAFGELDTLVPAYAATIHKSQGSEYPAVVIPRDKVAATVGRGSGIMGLVVATFAGTITVGGPTAAFPLLAILGAIGADRGVLVTFITAWATLGLQRILTWDEPMMGAEFSALRFAATFALPVLAGLVARALPIEVVLKGETRLRDRM